VHCRAVPLRAQYNEDAEPHQGSEDIIRLLATILVLARCTHAPTLYMPLSREAKCRRRGSRESGYGKQSFQSFHCVHIPFILSERLQLLSVGPPTITIHQSGRRVGCFCPGGGSFCWPLLRCCAAGGARNLLATTVSLCKRKLFITRSCLILVLATVLGRPRHADDGKNTVRNYQGATTFRENAIRFPHMIYRSQ
jgi:hypothetical protein